MNQRKKDFIAGAGWMLNIFLIGGMCALVYFCNQEPKEVGYTKAQIARMDDLIANLAPLHVSDLGINAE